MNERVTQLSRGTSRVCAAAMAMVVWLTLGACASSAETRDDEVPATADRAELPNASGDEATDTAAPERRATTPRPAPIETTDPLPAPTDVAAPPEDATVTSSGLAYVALREGPAGGRRPSTNDRVTVHYTGWTTDGERFDSSIVRGQPATFPVSGVIAGWTEGLQLMAVGDKYRFWIPSELAYGDAPSGGRPAGMLVFDVELLDIPSR